VAICASPFSLVEASDGPREAVEFNISGSVVEDSAGWREGGANGSASPLNVLPNCGCLNYHHPETNLHLSAAAVMPVIGSTGGTVLTGLSVSTSSA